MCMAYHYIMAQILNLGTFPNKCTKFHQTYIPTELKAIKGIHMRHLPMTVHKMKRTGKDKHSNWPYLVANFSLVITGTVLTIFMYYHCKKRSTRSSLRLAKNSSKTMKALVYMAMAVYSWDRDDVTLDNVSSTQQHEGDAMIPEMCRNSRVKRGCKVSYSCLKICHLSLTHSCHTVIGLTVCKNFSVLEHL